MIFADKLAKYFVPQGEYQLAIFPLMHDGYVRCSG